uniref:STE20-related kinase adapter protein beta n=1 Tax=Rhinopithecus bieti TaxID=61621 RepID=A0A2K6MVF2_RHIBE
VSPLDRFYTSRTQSETSIHQYLVDEPTLSWSRPSTRASEVVCSINVSHYELQVEIGRGFDNLTSVHLARHTPAGTLVTIKVTNLENCNEERLKVLQKAMILSHFFWHPNITTYWTVFSVDIISPFMAYGSASQLLRAYFPEGMGKTLIRNILFGAVRGLNYLHQYGCIRRSSKTSHILTSDDGLVTLSGLSHLHGLVKHGQRHRAVYDFPQFSTSVQPWLSPELLRQDLHGYNMKSDIYSVGITTCELASRQVPFQDMKRTQMLLQKLRVPPHSPVDISIFPQSESKMKDSQSGVDSGIGASVLISSGTHTVNNPEKRPSAMKEDSQDSILSLLPPAYNKPSVSLPPVLPWTEPDCDFPDEKDSYWEF